ncbi:MAG: molybdopterin-binding protein [Deltaproteobacteria bacterium]|jgi:molybdenum cofactor synthesis domain-containing protein|nr:molybdopterin-binding protein [Deltaproteobacteria bacterium]
MKTINTVDAVGTVLCHDLTLIVKDNVKTTAFRKGHVIKSEDIPLLLSMGKTRLFVWDLGDDMVHENDAAKRLAEICVPEGFVATEAKEGRVSFSAAIDGLFMVDLARLEAANDFEEFSVVVRSSGSPVKKGQNVAAVKIVPLAVHSDKIEQVNLKLGGRPLMQIRPYLPLKAGIAATGSEIYHGRIVDQFTKVVEDKLADFGISAPHKTICDDNMTMIVNAINGFIEKGVDLIILTGGMSVDPDDLTPGAIKAAGAELVSYGAPALPGAMFLVAYIGKVPVLGLPGCVMFGKRTVFDVILPRIAAGLRVTRREIRGLGHGGLCLECPTCIFPACSFGRGWPYSL